MLIIMHIHVEVVCLMVVCGASTAQVDGEGNIAYHKAVMAGRVDYIVAISTGFTYTDRIKLCKESCEERTIMYGVMRKGW